MAREVKPLNPHGNNQYSGVGVSHSTHNTATNITARIKRDAPDIAARMARGEYTSVEAAARDAGIRKAYWKIPRDDTEGVARAAFVMFIAFTVVYHRDKYRTGVLSVGLPR